MKQSAAIFLSIMTERRAAHGKIYLIFPAYHGNATQRRARYGEKTGIFDQLLKGHRHMTQETIYKKLPGFGLRVNAVQNAFEKIGADRYCELSLDGFTKALEGEDSDAVICAVMQKAYSAPGELLSKGIKIMFEETETGPRGFPKQWEEIAGEPRRSGESDMEQEPRIISPYKLLCRSCGLTRDEGTEFAGARHGTGKDWWTDRRTCPQGVLQELRALYDLIDKLSIEEEKRIRAMIKKGAAISVKIYDGLPPYMNVQHAVLRRAIERLPADLAPLVTLSDEYEN